MRLLCLFAAPLLWLRLRCDVLLGGHSFLGAAASLLLLAAFSPPARGAEGAGGAANPFPYDISEFRKVPPELLRYREETNFAVSIASPTALAVDTGNRIYVAGATAVAVFDRPGEPSLLFSLDHPARCMAATASGDLLVGAADHIDVYSPTGGLRSSWISLGERAIISSVAARGDHVYIADCGTHAVWHFDSSGRLLGNLGASGDSKHFIIPSPMFDVAIAPDDTVWIVNPGKCLIERYSRELRFIGQWGRSSMQIDGFCGCCNPSHVAVLADGRVVTSEKGIPRVKVYTAGGVLGAVVAAPALFAQGSGPLDLAVDSAGRVLVLDPQPTRVRIFVERSKAGSPPFEDRGRN